MKMVIAIIIGAVVDLIVFYSLCRAAKSGDKIIQEAWGYWADQIGKLEKVK